MQSSPRIKIILASGLFILAAALLLRTRLGGPNGIMQQVPPEITALEQSLAAQPANSELRYRLSDYYVKIGRLPAAEQVVSDGCQMNPGDVHCWLTLGDLQQQQNHLRAAAKSYHQALALMPNHAVTLCALAQLEIKRGRERSARQLLSRAAKSGEKTALYHFVRAQLLMRTAPSEVAVVELKQSVKLEPKFLPSWLQLARLSAELNQTSDMEMACRGALAVSPDNPDALTILSRAKLQNGTVKALQEARTLAERALSVAPQHAQGHAILGLLALRANKSEEAMGHLESALLADGADIEVRANLAKAYQRAGQTDDAARQLQVLQSEIDFSERVRHLITRAKLRPDDASLRCQIGELYAAAGAREKAAAQFEAALEINPRHASAQQGLEKLGGDRP